MASDPFTNGPNRLDPGVMRTADSLHDVQQTDCCIVGGGPAGTVLALLLARKGVSVMLLEMHKNFDRDFRGDTIHPSVMEILNEIGLADRLLQMRHTKLPRVSMKTAPCFRERYVRSVAIRLSGGVGGYGLYPLP